MELNHELLADDGPKYDDPVRFRRLVGRLVYLTNTQPDIQYAVHVLSQVMHDPREAHWDVAVRIVRYLKGYPGQGVFLKADSNLRI